MKLKTLVQGLVVAGLVTPALAQETQRIEITGSSIKRVQAEGALPVQVIRAADLDKQGISNVEQLVSILSSTGNGQDSLVSNQGGDFLNSLINSGRSANNGSSGVSLRGLGAQNTLVLLNGRRVAAHGLNGKSVDLNSIPLAAIDRIEILKDGASAIYGTDAIGGVMNFILKREYSGLQASGFVDITEAGGGNIARGDLLWGTGVLDRDGFNLMATLAVDGNTRLRGRQRDFHNGYQPERGLAPDTTGTPYANVSQAAGTAYDTARAIPGFPAGVTYNRINLLALNGDCDDRPNQYIYRTDVTGFPRNAAACTYDYGKDWSLMQPVDRINLVARANFRLGKDNLGFFEVTASRVKSATEYTPNQLTLVSRGANYPAFVVNAQGQTVRAPYYPLDLAAAMNALVPGSFNINLPVRMRWRCLECGPRQQETTSYTSRWLAGLEGSGAGWDYKLGISESRSEANTVLGDGNLFEARMKAAMDTGLINPWLLPGQTQTPEALALIDGASARGAKLFGGEARSVQLDGTASRELFKLPAGPVYGAVGFEVREETFKFRDDTGVQPLIIGIGSPAAIALADRGITALFAELNVPIVKGLEAQLAVRKDSYSDFGSTTNPKVALSWRPVSNLLLRGSYNKGFHAPDFGPLYEGEVDGQFTSDVNDPSYANCATAPDPLFCSIRPATLSGGNPDLKPEKSKQWSAGIVVAPLDWLTLSADWFGIEITDRISNRTAQEVLANSQALGQYIFRNPDGSIDYVRGGWLNVAGDKVSGIDLGVTLNRSTPIGRISAAFDGTYLKSYRTRKLSTDPWTERVGEFGDFDFLWDLKLRWKYSANVSWAQGNWSTTLTQIYKSGYKAEVDGYGSGVVPPNYPTRVDSYTVYNLTASYTGIKNLTLTGGIKNLFDKDPPFSAHNVDNVAGAGWDARVGDPRGRAFTLKATYKFF
jgi:iron complex outermembrane recepter protein